VAAENVGREAVRTRQRGVADGLRAHLRAPAAALFLCLFAAQAAVLVLSPILVEVARDFGTSTATVGLLRALTGLVAGSTALLLGRAPRRLALRDLLLAGASLLAFGSLLSAAAPAVWVLALAQIPIGIALAVLLAAATTGAAEWVAPEQRARVLAWALAGQPVAWIVGMPLAGAVVCILGFLGGARTLAGSVFGLDAAPERRLGIMGLRAAATQYGYLLGAAAGGVAIALAGYQALGLVLGALFALAAVPHLVPVRGSG
jgi:predicted MFS family arabinose efflux permease